MLRVMRLAAFVAALSAVAITAAPALAEVRFGKNVFIGGHDFSHQTFDRRHRAKIFLYERRPAHAGCRWRADGSGGKVKVCHLQTRHAR
jgi:hypothetical protein